MNEKFLKPKTKEIDNSSIDLECVEQQLKSMKLGYISHAFIVKGMADDFDIFFKMNFDEFGDEIKAKAEEHALKHIANPEYLTPKVTENMPKDVQQCIQAMLMIYNKKMELEAQDDKTEVMKRNIAWLKELKKKMIEEKSEATTSTNPDLEITE